MGAVTTTLEYVVRRARARWRTAKTVMALVITLIVGAFVEYLGIPDAFWPLLVFYVVTEHLAGIWIKADALTSFARAKKDGFVEYEVGEHGRRITVLPGCRKPWLVMLHIDMVELDRFMKAGPK